MNTWAPILQMLIFYDRGPKDGIQRINLSMTDTFGLYDKPWAGTRFEGTMEIIGTDHPGARP